MAYDPVRAMPVAEFLQELRRRLESGESKPNHKIMPLTGTLTARSTHRAGLRARPLYGW